MNLEDIILLVGGYDGKFYLLLLDFYFLSEDIIKFLRLMSSVRLYISVAKLNGYFYVIGGENGFLWYDIGIKVFNFYEFYFLCFLSNFMLIY